MKLSKIYAINVYIKFLEENTTDFDHANLWGESQGPGGRGEKVAVVQWVQTFSLQDEKL